MAALFVVVDGLHIYISKFKLSPAIVSNMAPFEIRKSNEWVEYEKDYRCLFDITCQCGSQICRSILFIRKIYLIWKRFRLIEYTESKPWH